MTNIWKFSKSTSLTLSITGLAGILVLAFAYHLRHYTEILSGVIGGLTIILGMVIAEWLRSTREQAGTALIRFHNLASNAQSLVFNPQYLLEDALSSENKDELQTSIDFDFELGWFELFYRWPQPNAREVRALAYELRLKLFAMQRDAIENGHLWSTEKRYQLSADFSSLFVLLVGEHTAGDEFWENSLKYRDTELRPGMPISWRRQAVREAEN